MLRNGSFDSFSGFSGRVLGGSMLNVICSSAVDVLIVVPLTGPGDSLVRLLKRDRETLRKLIEFQFIMVVIRCPIWKNQSLDVVLYSNITDMT